MSEKLVSQSVLNQILDRFDEAWQQGPTDLSTFVASLAFEELKSSGLSKTEVLCELVCVDLEYRWRSWQKREGRHKVETAVGAHSTLHQSANVLCVEDYLATFPELNSGSSLALACEEYRVRMFWGDRPPISEYLKRFPDHVSELEFELAKVSETLRQEADRAARQPATASLDTTRLADTDYAPQKPTRMPDKLPEIPDYDTLEFLGRGGMGMVVKARHKLLQRLVAIKIPFSRCLDDGGERFLREARTAASLRNQYLCAIYEVRQAEEFSYIVLAYIDGQTLDKWARAAKPSSRDIAIIVAKLAQAVHYAHEHGVIHRDIKPGNIMVESASGEPVLMDFGLAKQMNSGDAFLTQSGQVLGTPAFMSPEQAAGRSETVGPLTDVYALGAVLYALVCGRAPFSGSVGEVIHKVQSAEPPAPRKLAPQVHHDLETICQKAMSKEIGARYSSAQALAEDLERFAAGDAILARPISIPQRVYRRLRRQPATVGIVAACLLALVVTGVFVTVSGRQQRRLASLRQEYKSVLGSLDSATDDEVTARISRLEELSREIAELSSTSREELTSEVTAGLGADIERRLQVERLPDQEAASLAKRIELLESRDATAAQRLARQLASKQVGWDAIPELSGSLAVIANSFDASFAVTAESGKLVRQHPDPKQHFAMVASSAAPAAANVRVEAEFLLTDEVSEPFGIVLGASQRHTGDILTLDFSPTGKYLASGGADGYCKIWNHAEQTLVHSRHFSGGGITQAMFTSNENVVLLRNWSDIFIFDWANDKVVAQHKALFPFSVSADKELVATCGLERVSIIDVASGEVLGAIPHPPKGRWQWLGLAADHPTVVLAHPGGEAATFDWTTGKRLHTLRHDPEEKIATLAYAMHEERVALATKSKRVYVYHLKDGQEAANLSVPDNLSSLALSPDGKLLAAAFGGTGGRVWEAESGKIRFDLDPVNWGLYQLQFADDGRYLLAASDERAISWDTKTGRRNANLIGHLKQVRAVTSHTSPPLAASGGRDHLVHVRDLFGKERPLALGADRCALQVRIDRSVEPHEAIVRLTLAGSLVATERVPLVADQLPRPQRLRVERVHGLVRVWLNQVLDEAKPTLEFHEVFPPPAGGTIGLVWPANVAVAELIAYQRQEAEGLERLDFAEKFYAEGRFEDAAKLFHAVAVATADQPADSVESLWQEATYKEAISRQAADDAAAAEELFAQLQMAQGERWPLYALVQLWTLRLRAEQFQQAEALIQQAQKQGISFAQVTALIPEETRADLIAIGRRDVGAIDSYYQYSPDRVDKVKRLCELEKLVYGHANGATQLLLIRALRVNGDMAAAQAQAREWLADGQSPSNDAIDELAWMLREEQKYDQAAALLDRFLLEESPEYEPRLGMLWIDRAYVAFARGDREAAQRCLGHFITAARQDLDGIARHNPQSALMAGFLLDDQEGMQEEAKRVWAQGLEVLLNDRATQRRTHGDWLYLWLLSSLSGEADDAELQLAFRSLLSGVGSDSIIGPLITMITASPTGQERMARQMKVAFQSPRGKAIARRIAYQQLSFVEMLREPMLLMAVGVSSPMFRPAGLSPLEDETLWKLGADFYDALIMKGTVSSDQLAALAAAQVTPFLLTGALRQFKDQPELGAPLAYFSGLRQLTSKQEAIAAKCFELALAMAPSESPTATLAQAELHKLRVNLP